MALSDQETGTPLQSFSVVSCFSQTLHLLLLLVLEGRVVVKQNKKKQTMAKRAPRSKFTSRLLTAIWWPPLFSLKENVPFIWHLAHVNSEYAPVRLQTVFIMNSPTSSNEKTKMICAMLCCLHSGRQNLFCSVNQLSLFIKGLQIGTLFTAFR